MMDLHTGSLVGSESIQISEQRHEYEEEQTHLKPVYNLQYSVRFQEALFSLCFRVDIQAQLISLKKMLSGQM